MSFSQYMKEFTFTTISPNMKPLLLPTPPLTNTITSEITHLINLKNGYTNKVKTLVLTKMKTTLKSQDASPPPSPHMSTYNHYHQPLESKMEVNMLKNEIDVLQKGLRYMFEGGAGKMTLDELRILESNLEVWMYHIRSAKMDIMAQEIQLLKNKEGILKAANKCLQEQMEMQFGAVNNDPTMANIPYPLTIQNEIYQC
ncbi:hypothetical protein LXL04_007823 [Taraxacum kok-saghyz]